jgi:hypothetical protein
MSVHNKKESEAFFTRAKTYILPVSLGNEKSKAVPFTTLFLEHIPYLAVLVAYLIIGFVVGNFLDRDFFLDIKWRYEITTSFTYLFILCFLFIKVVMIFTRFALHFIEILTGHVREKKQNFENAVTFKRVGGFIIVYATIPLFLSFFSNIKQSIPLLHPFTWDRFFMKMDHVLHGGHHPWTLLQPILGYPAVTKAIDYLYVSWFLSLFTIILWMGWSNKRRLRAQFFLSFILIWILIGTVLATFFSSAGPCYYSDVTGGVDPFGPLMSYLDSIHESSFLYARKYQKGIWEAYAGNISLPFGGISAMPSVHVATAVLFALAGWSSTRILGIVFTVYALLIQLGSVHLGWHYAVDGYFSAILTYLIWKLADRVLKGLGWGPNEESV